VIHFSFDHQKIVQFPTDIIIQKKNKQTKINHKQLKKKHQETHVKKKDLPKKNLLETKKQTTHIQNKHKKTTETTT